MQVTFALTPEDLLALEEFQIQRARGVSGNQMLAFICILPLLAALAVFLMPGGPSPRMSNVVNVLVSTGIPIIAVALRFMLFRRRTRTHLKNLEKEIPGIYEPRTLGLDPDYLLAVDATGESKTRWNAVKEVAHTPERIFIQLVGGTGHVIPCSAFASPEEATRFVETARGYLKAAAGGVGV